ncbi:hypothetical protein [Prevotella pallens]|nr:hypothetical protein [Prevotella pallens]
MRTNILLVNGFVIKLKKLWLSLIYTKLIGYGAKLIWFLTIRSA